MKDNADKLIEKLGSYPLFVTGAGISVASGIPTFRGSDPDAVWSNDIMEMGTFKFFSKEPVAQWAWYLKRFEACLDAKPNDAHKALVEIEDKFIADGNNFHIITQNVDGLHISAGSKSITEIHGAARKIRCSSKWCEAGEPDGFMEWGNHLDAFKKEKVYKNLPKCTHCDSHLRPHVLWFDEGYYGHNDYGMDKVSYLVGNITSITFVGTSFSVGITELLTYDVGWQRGLPMFAIDPYMKESPNPNIELMKEASEILLPEVAKRLKD